MTLADLLAIGQSWAAQKAADFPTSPTDERAQLAMKYAQDPVAAVMNFPHMGMGGEFFHTYEWAPPNIPVPNAGSVFPQAPQFSVAVPPNVRPYGSEPRTYAQEHFKQQQRQAAQNAPYGGYPWEY